MRRSWANGSCCGQKKNNSHKILCVTYNYHYSTHPYSPFSPFGWPSTGKVMSIFIFHREKGFSDHVRPLNQVTFCYKHSSMGPIRLLFSNFVLRVILIRRRENFWGDSNFNALRKLIFSTTFIRTSILKNPKNNVAFVEKNAYIYVYLRLEYLNKHNSCTRTWYGGRSHTDIHTYIHTHTHTYIHKTYIHTYIHIHTHTHTNGMTL